MDEIVRRAMTKWPNVPAVYGWLSLDGRGNWRLKSERIGNSMLNEFISRNYARDDEGRWFFQNGPQRVFVSLAYAPWILRIDDAGHLTTHTGLKIESIDGAWLDERGIVVLRTPVGPAILDDRDAETFSTRFVDSAGNTPSEEQLLALVESVTAGDDISELHLPYAGNTARILPIASADVPRQFGFVREPQPEETHARTA